MLAYATKGESSSRVLGLSNEKVGGWHFNDTNTNPCFYFSLFKFFNRHVFIFFLYNAKSKRKASGMLNYFFLFLVAETNLLITPRSHPLPNTAMQ